MKIRYYIQVNEKQIQMLLKALERVKEQINTDTEENDYKSLQRQIEPLGRTLKS